MPSTRIPAPRTPPFDSTGHFSREWYLFFYNLFDLVLSGSNDISIADVLVQPQFDMGTVDAEIKGAQLEALIVNSGSQDQFAKLVKDLQGALLRPYPPEVVPPVNVITSISANKTFAWDESMISASVTGLTVTLPKATVGGPDRTVSLGTTGSVTIAPGGSDVILLPTTDTTVTLYNKGDSLTFRPVNSTTWVMV